MNKFTELIANNGSETLKRRAKTIAQSHVSPDGGHVAAGGLASQRLQSLVVDSWEYVNK